ncbi:MAG: DUF4433 domain-containing protein [Rhodoglobus sp.]
MAECIHGLEVPLCDVCYPKTLPEKPRAARSTPSTRTPAASTTSRKSVNAAEQRVYHVTHVRNLASILTDGLRSADAAPEVDVSSGLTRELRMSAEVAPQASVAEYVPFYLAPDAVLWEDLRAGGRDETRWSAAARKATPADFVFLVSTIGRLGDGVVVADGDAAATFTRFFAGDGIQRAVERLHANEDARRTAEALVHGSVPFAAVQLIGVANDPVRERVREMVAATFGTATKVAVYPPWFQSA